MTTSHTAARAVATRLYAALDGYCDAVSVSTGAGRCTIDVVDATDHDRDEVVSTVEAILDDLGSITVRQARLVAGYLDGVTVMVDGRRESSYMPTPGSVLTSVPVTA